MIRFIFLFIFISHFLYPADQFKKLTLEERAKYKMKIEEVYQKIRTKGKSSSVPDFKFFLKEAEKDLKFTNALEIYFDFKITEETLQAELERIVKNTKQPETLREIFEALGNDPDTITEVFVRNVLTRRLLENYYYNDDKFHREWRNKIEEELKNVKFAIDLKYLSGSYQETLIKSYERREGPPVESTINYGKKDYENFIKNLSKKFERIYNSKEGILQAGAVSRIIEDREGLRVIGILDKGKDYIKICTSFWQKKRFSQWWEEVEKQIPSVLNFKKASFTMPQLRNSNCKDDTWYKLPGPPDERYGCATLTYGDRMAIWGGINDEFIPVNTGFIYNATSDSWTEMSNTNAPSARKEFSFATSSSVLFVWGGVDIDGNYLNSGAIYNISNDTWTPTNNTGNVPPGRKNATALYGGVTGWLIFGGENASGKLNDFYGYTTLWIKIDKTNPPSPRAGATAVLHSDNINILFWGGRGSSNQALNDGKIFNLSAGGGWQNIPDPPSGNARYEHKMFFYGGNAYIWGGRNENSALNTGIIYNFSSNSWSSMSASPLQGRFGHSAILAGSTIIIWGGQSFSTFYNDGAKYDISSNSWTTISTGPSARSYHSAGYTGTYMLIWGGRNQFDVLGSGARYNISNNTWTTMNDGGAPTPRYDYGAIWTGTEAIIFAGYFPGTTYNDGKKYIPSTDVWESIATADILSPRSYPAFYYWESEGKAITWGGTDQYASNLGDGAIYDIALDDWQLMDDSDSDYPSPRSYFASAWDPVGEKMYIWGGYIDDDPYYTNTGAIYDPSTDSWTSITTNNAPLERAMATGIWTGSKFIVWGGEDENWEVLNTGGVYDPVSDSWTPTDITDEDTPSGRAYHMAEYIDGRMFIWGGDNYSESLNDGAFYNVSSNSWTALPESSLAPRGSSGIKWNGRDIFLWGGNDTNQFPFVYFGDGERYNPNDNNFTPISNTGAPKKRSNISTLWIDKYFFVWGGVGYQSYPVTGALYCSCLVPPPHSTNPTPSNGGLVCYSSSVELSCTNGEANLFDIYIDSSLECENSTSCYCSKALGTGSHSWYVVSKNHCGQAIGTPPQWSFDVITSPGAASNPDPTNGSYKCSSSPVVATWTAGTYATQYDVYLGSSKVCENITSTSCNFGNLSGGDYTWYVVSKNICGTQQSPTWGFSIDTSLPTQPSNPDPANGSSVCPSPDLSWSASTGARTYDVYYDTSKICADITSTTCDPGTISSGSHSWYVVAKNGCGNVSSPTWTFSIKNPPGKATNPNPANYGEVCTRTPTLSFTAAPNAETYDVYVDNELKCANITSPSCSPGSLSVGEHTWYVVAKNGCPEHNNQSDTWTFYVDEYSPGEATNTFPPDGSYVCPNPTLDWDPAPNARRYDIYVDNSPYTSCTNITRTYCNTNITSGTHTWKIVSKNNCGSTPTPASGTFSFSILSVPSQPTVQDKDICALSGVEITWSSVPGATGYDLRVDGSTIIQNVTSPYTYQPGDSNSHTYQIRAKNSYCTTSWSTSTSGIDDNQTPSTPSITSIQDVDVCAQSGIKIYYNAGAPATRHDLYRNGQKVVEGYTSGATYNPGSTSNYTYYIKAINGTCSKDSSTQDFADADNTPSTPSITSIQDVDTCAQSGIKIYYNAGSPATRHDLYRNGEKVVEGYVSGTTYNPGSTSNYTYYIKAINGTCYKDSSTQDFADADNTPSTPSITSIQDVDVCAQSGIKIYYNAGAPATRHDLYRNGQKVVEGYVSGTTYNPGSTSNYTYYIKAINGTCTKDSSTQDFADANNTPTPTISGANQNTCPNEFVLLSTQSGMTDYQWYRNDQAITGANSYQYSATLTGTYTVYYKNSYGCGNTSAGHSVTIVPCYGPEPVADGKLYGNAAKFKKASNFGTTGNIDVTFDNTTCSNDHIAILYGNLIGTNRFDGYDGCALANGGNSGSTTFNSTGQENVWYNIIWVSSTGRAGHPGYYYQNGQDLQRNWSALGFCSITSEMQNDPSCNGVPGP